MTGTKKPRHPNSLANLKPIQPGEARNPSGRPSIPEDVKAALKAATPAAVKTLVEIMTSGKSEDTRVKAASIILDRVYGKAAVQVDVRHTDVGAMHLQLLEEIRTRRAERLGERMVDVTPKVEGHTDKATEYDPPKSNE
jgi:hypothetical protein